MKAVAVPYIIAILLGVGVIGLVGYWLFVSGGQFGAGATEQNCRNALLNMCNLWAADGYSADKLPTISGVLGTDACRKLLGTTLGTDQDDNDIVSAWRAACQA